ncbi:MAG: hypothetical protein ACI9EW_001598 [Cellvibrionaceae bacterium]|jgi:hypothetical protein
MMNSNILLDPTAELTSAHRNRLPRPDSIKDKTIGLLDISKARGDIFLDRIEAQLVAAGAIVKRYKKPTFARIAPTQLKQQIIMECDVVIEGLAD